MSKFIQLKEFRINGATYRQQFRTCNKPICKCHSGHRHGPYWYVNNVKYLGVTLPDSILVYLDLRDGKQETIKKMLVQRRAEYEALRRQLQQVQNEIFALNAVLSGDVVDPAVLRRLRLSDLVFKEN